MLVNAAKSKIKKRKHFAHQFVQLIVLWNQLVCYYYPSKNIFGTTFVVPLAHKICEMHACSLCICVYCIFACCTLHIAYCAVHFFLIASALYDQVVR